MRRLVWTCDRCGTEAAVPERIDIDHGYTPAALRREPLSWSHLPGWLTFTDDSTVSDVCPGCITAGEHVDRALREAELAVAFNQGNA